MSGPACTAPLTLAELIEYWLDEAAPDRAEAIEAHLIGCGSCSDRLQDIVALADGMKRIVRTGGVGVFMTKAFVQRLKRAGLRVREYRLQPSDAVSCTIGPTDDWTVAHLSAPLRGVGRLDAVLQDPNAPGPIRFENVPFDESAGEIVFAPDSAGLRSLGVVTQRMRLVAVDEAGERVLGDYTFNHSPYRPGA
jgi:hypothetical protein